MIEVFIQDKTLILHADDTGNWSEITPLPGWSHETIEDVLAAVFEEDFDRYPSVAFATEMLYCQNEPAIVPYAILLKGTGEQILDEAKKVSSHLAKVKVGSLDLDTTIDVCKQLFAMGFRLRLDFNRQWSVSDALALSHAFEKHQFEYFEEPTQELDVFCALSTQKIAVDETIYSYDAWELPNVSAIVLKPPQWGGVGDCLEMAQKAYTCGKQIVLSNTFKTHIGLQSLLHFARLLKEPLAPLGLGFLALPEEKLNLERIGVVSFEPALK